MAGSGFKGDAVVRLRSAGQSMGVFCMLLLVALPVAVALYWALSDAAALAARVNLHPAAAHEPLRSWQRLAAALIAEAALAPLLVGLWQARACFVLFARGQVFTRQAVRHLKRFAGWSLASALAGIVAGAAVSVVITWHNPPGMRHLAVGIGTDQVFTLFFAGMVWLMAAVIGQGQALADENASFV